MSTKTQITETTIEQIPQLVRSLNDNEILALLIDLTHITPEQTAQLTNLSPTEHHRAQRLKIPAKQRTYILSHRILHHALQAIITTPYEIKNTKHGKPYIENTNIEFNISHTNTHLLIALSRHTPIGCDIETHNPTTDTMHLAQRFYPHADHLALTQITNPTQQAAQFYQQWTLREAITKLNATQLHQTLEQTCKQLTQQHTINSYQLTTHTDTTAPTTTQITIATAHHLTTPPAIHIAKILPHPHKLTKNSE